MQWLRHCLGCPRPISACLTRDSPLLPTHFPDNVHLESTVWFLGPIWETHMESWATGISLSQATVASIWRVNQWYKTSVFSLFLSPFCPSSFSNKYKYRSKTLKDNRLRRTVVIYIKLRQLWLHQSKATFRD